MISDVFNQGLLIAFVAKVSIYSAQVITTDFYESLSTLTCLYLRVQQLLCLELSLEMSHEIAISECSGQRYFFNFCN